MADKLRVGIIGRTGKGNYGHGVDTVWADIPDVEVVAVADENENGRRDAQRRTMAPRAYADFREMIEKERPNLVAIGSRWIDQHREMALAAAEFGCHMFMEKPFMRTPAEADEVVRACEMRHLKLALAHQTRYSPAAATARRLIKEGQIGDILEIRGRGKEDHRGGGEDLWVLGSHILDLMRFLVGDAKDCTATVLSKGKPITQADVVEGNEGLGFLAGDTVHAQYTFERGIIGSFNSVRGAGATQSRFAVQIFGSKGIMEIGFGYPAPVWILKDPAWSPGRSGAQWQPVGAQGIGQSDAPVANGLHAGNVAAVTDLLQAIQEERQPLCSMYDGRASVEMIMAVFASTVAGHRVSLPLADRTHPLAPRKS